MDFGQAIKELKDGKMVKRSGSDWRDTFLTLIQPVEYNPTNDHLWAGLDKSPWICIKTSDYNIEPWQPSQTDILAEDWEVEL
ncbi:DUF2829 domain-containing protein [Paenibacillus sp. ALE1]